MKFSLRKILNVIQPVLIIPCSVAYVTQPTTTRATVASAPQWNTLSQSTTCTTQTLYPSALKHYSPRHYTAAWWPHHTIVSLSTRHPQHNTPTLYHSPRNNRTTHTTITTLSNSVLSIPQHHASGINIKSSALPVLHPPCVCHHSAHYAIQPFSRRRKSTNRLTNTTSHPQLPLRHPPCKTTSPNPPPLEPQ